MLVQSDASMKPLPGTLDMTDLLRTLQGETTDVEFALQIGVPRSTYTMVKHGRRYASEKLVAGLLRTFADHSEEIVAAFSQQRPFSDRPSARRAAFTSGR